MTRPSASTAATVAAGACWATRQVLGRMVRADRADRADSADRARWTRINHRGQEISLLEGPSVAAGLLVGALTAGGRAGAAGALAVAGAATFGLVDDLAEDAGAARKGLRGHLGALARGELTTGALKVLGIGATGLIAAAVLGGGPGRAGRSLAARGVDVVTSGALIAASANLVNLLDLRPGRALKAGGIAALPALLHPRGRSLAAACLGSAAAALGPDLAERDMLGDGGANALGALLGTAAVASAPRPVRLALLAGAVGLTLASERVSFTKVIERTPALAAIDRWGRRADGRQ